jgi:hypothetical protein
MDPLGSALSSLVNALQNAAQSQAAAPVQGAQPTAVPMAELLAMVDQDVSLLYLGQTADGGLLLQLPSGQTLAAQGQMPYPDGTQLLVRILAGSGADAPLRLQTLQAAPPAAPAILAPLLQGEAAPLQASLAQPDPPPGLASLAELFQFLGGAGSGQEPSLPDPAQLQAALDTLPAPALASLKSLLDLAQAPAGSAAAAAPAGQGAGLAAALEAWLNAAPAAASGAAAQRPADPAQAVIQDVLQRFQAALERHPEVPAAQGDTLTQWLRNLVSAPDARTAAAQDRPAAADSPAQVLQTLLGGRAGAPASAPETWESWIRSSVKVLSDPATVPQSAAFHAAQAKEGTAFYEIPLPWSPQHPLQMWLESDRDPRDPGQPGAETHRVLLGLAFSNLGETRLGLAKSGANLQVRVWAEHPEGLEATREAMESELKDLGSTVDLKILRLDPGPGGTIPSLRSEVTGTTLHALG